jgi:hypothetical protein
MIFGAGKQNSTLSAAGKITKDTSYRTESANKVSAKVVSDKNTQSKEPSKPIDTIKNVGADKQKASYEGLMHSASTVIQPKNVGYDNKNLQKARYDKSINFLNKTNINNNISSTSSGYSIMDNYSKLKIVKNSSSMINNIVKNNMRFN